MAMSKSIMPRFLSVEKARFFFQPVELYLHLTNLLVQLFLQRLLLRGVLLATLPEALGDQLLGSLFPLGDLHRMDPGFGGQSLQWLYALEGFQGDLGLELGRVALLGH